MKNSLEYIKNQVVSCTKCDLCKTRKNAVPGKGSPSAKIFFIGEAPGRSAAVDHRGAQWLEIRGVLRGQGTHGVGREGARLARSR